MTLADKFQALVIVDDSLCITQIVAVWENAVTQVTPIRRELVSPRDRLVFADGSTLILKRRGTRWFVESLLR